MGSKNKFDYAGRFEPEQLATYLESIAAGLRQERVRVAAGGRSIVLEPRGIVRLEIAASLRSREGPQQRRDGAVVARRRGREHSRAPHQHRGRAGSRGGS